jgi:hypothetical protein
VAGGGAGKRDGDRDRLREGAMASDGLEVELARLLGEIAALARRESRAGPQAAQPSGAGGEAERLRAALGATADRLVRAAARFERLGLDAAAATVRLVERDARKALREFEADRAEGREEPARASRPKDASCAAVGGAAPTPPAGSAAAERGFRSARP